MIYMKELQNGQHQLHPLKRRRTKKKKKKKTRKEKKEKKETETETEKQGKYCRVNSWHRHIANREPK